MVRSLPCQAPPPSPAHTHSRKRVLTLAHQCALNQPPRSSFLCPTKVLPTFLKYHTIPFPELYCFTTSALCSYGTVQKNLIYRLNWGLLRDFSYLGWIALISSTRSTRVAGFRTDACLGGCPSFSCPESLDKFQGFSLCLWIQIVQV